jgi:hypothetical protein
MMVARDRPPRLNLLLEKHVYEMVDLQPSSSSSIFAGRSSVVHVCRLPGTDYFISTTSASKVIPKAAEVAVPVAIDRSAVRAAYLIYL